MRLAPALLLFAVATVSLDAAAGDRGAQRAARQAARQDKAEARKAEHAQDVQNNTRDPRVNKRQRRQASRTAKGVRRGSLTPAEQQALATQQAALASSEAAMKSDGALSVTERQSLHDQLHGLSQQIFEEKHDDERVVVRARCDRDGVTGAEAKQHLHKAQRLVDARQKLGGDLSDAERQKLQAEHDALVDELFEEAREEAEK